MRTLFRFAVKLDFLTLALLIHLKLANFAAFTYEDILYYWSAVAFVRFILK